MASKKSFWWTVIIILLTLIIGFVLGTFFSSKAVGRKLFLSSGNKINVILDIIDEDYVDTVDMRNLVEEAIPKLVSELDPHSNYIPSENLKAIKEDMDGHFGGIGVNYIQQDDTVMVVSVSPGGPSEQAGLRSGDRIVMVDDSLFVGPKITQDKILSTLRGATGSKVMLGIKRKSSDEIVPYEITRGEIPVKTIKVAYEVDKGIGFIKIYDKFGRTTYDEFVMAIAKLTDAGCKSFIIDLRMNAGGLMDAAVNIVNEFLPQGRLIVYTEGKSYPRIEAISNGTGTCQNSQVVILMDQLSASASEIVAGAIQDNDRGLIIGRRSYGKGLVQNQIALSDGSAIRLTIARYYTPSGRSIQRKYELGKAEAYNQEWLDQFSHGESFSEDSIKLDKSLKYSTYSGRTVYGGGGIMPDIFVPADTAGITSYFINLENKDIFQQYAFYYIDKNRGKLDTYKDYPSMLAYLKTQSFLNEIVDFAERKGIKRRSTLINISASHIITVTHACILRNYFGDDAFYPVYMSNDPMIRRAVEAIKKGEALPESIASKSKEKLSYSRQNNVPNNFAAGFPVQIPHQLFAAHHEFTPQH